MYDPELDQTVTLAKSGEAKYSRHEWYQVIKRLSNRHRTLGQSPEQAFAKFIQDADGRTLYAAMKAAPARPEDFEDVPPSKKKKPGLEIDGGESEPLTKLRAMAAQVLKEDASLSAQQAMSRVLKTADGVRLLVADRQQRLGV